MKFSLPEIKKSIWGTGKKVILSYINPKLEKKFNTQKSQFLREIRQHPVSKELSNWTSPSAFLKGSPYGSLFGFLGLPASYKPVEDLIEYLERVVVFIPVKEISLQGEYSLSYIKPSNDDLTARFPLLWHKGRSWVDAIEHGVSNLGNYLAINYAKNSNSTQGIQVEYPVHPGASFDGTSYLTQMFLDLDLKLKQ